VEVHLTGCQVLHLSARRWSAAVAAMALALTLTACTGGSGDREATASGTAGATSGVPGPTSTGSPSRPSSGSPGPATGGTSPATAVRGTAKPSVAISLLKPVAIGRPATVTRGVTVTVGKLTTMRVTANAPGETSGSAVSFVVEVRNAAGRTVDLGGVAVTVSFANNVPAVPSSSAPNAPLTGKLATGKSARGTYVFRMPESAVRTVRIQVATDFAAGIAVFRR
jgi:hypothetical protein